MLSLCWWLLWEMNVTRVCTHHTNITTKWYINLLFTASCSCKQSRIGVRSALCVQFAVPRWSEQKWSTSFSSSHHFFPIMISAIQIPDQSSFLNNKIISLNIITESAPSHRLIYKLICTDINHKDELKYADEGRNRTKRKGLFCKRELTEKKKQKQKTYVHLILVRLRYHFIVPYSWSN